MWYSNIRLYVSVHTNVKSNYERQKMSIDRIILSVFGIMFVVGAFDYLRGNKNGLGKKFFEGLQTFAPLMLAMAGFIVLTDLLAKLLTPVISPVFSAVGADPGLFSGIILACDNGAYPLAEKLGTTPYSAGFGGILLGAGGLVRANRAQENEAS